MKFYPAEKNVGGWDRRLRLVAGPALLVVAVAALLDVLVLGSILLAVSIVVGAILTVTGLTQKCPANQLVRMNTFRRRTESGTETAPEMEPESPSRRS